MPDDEIEDIDDIDDIDEPVADEPTADVVEVVTVLGDEDDHVDYEIADWSGESRAVLDSMLGAEGVRHVWQGTTLVVRAGDQDAVDRLIEVVNQAAGQSLDPDRTRIVYEVGEWSAAMQTSLADALGVADIAFEWDEAGDLVVYEDDEARVEEILDAMPDPDDPELTDADGVEVQEVLSRLWQAAGTLAKDPADAAAVLAAVESANQLEHTGLPFGFEPQVWRGIVGDALTLRVAFESEDPDDQLSDDELQERCGQLRDTLRAYV